MQNKSPHLSHYKKKFAPASGLPSHYPVPEKTNNLLFYIQRNHNLNTVIYSVNKDASGFIKESHPISVMWKRYDEAGEMTELSFMQSKLAYGYESTKINNHSFKFHFVSYPSLIFYLGPNENGYGVFCHLDGQCVLLSNIYIHADEFGLFPEVKFIELYGTTVEKNESILHKIKL